MVQDNDTMKYEQIVFIFHGIFFGLMPLVLNLSFSDNRQVGMRVQY